MRQILLLMPVVFLFMAFSCDKENKIVGSNTCSVSNPIKDLPWLKQKAQELEAEQPVWSKLYQADYNGQTIFFIQVCCISCNSTSPVYNCQGEFLGTSMDRNVFPNFDAIVKNIKPIYTPTNFTCGQ